MASYLPDDFNHTIFIPTEVHPLGGLCCGFDTSDLMIHMSRAGLEIPIRYRHQETGMQLEAKLVNFWTFDPTQSPPPLRYASVGEGFRGVSCLRPDAPCRESRTGAPPFRGW